MRGIGGGTIGIKVRYTLEPLESSTRVVRDVQLDFRLGAFGRIFEPLLVPIFRRENDRVLRSLKRYIESDCESGCESGAAV
jgi:hypothetical protein